MIHPDWYRKLGYPPDIEAEERWEQWLCKTKGTKALFDYRLKRVNDRDGATRYVLKCTFGFFAVLILGGGAIFLLGLAVQSCCR